jgi:hypothetical protein
VNVDTADSQHLSRISKMLIAGIGVAFAWVLLSLALGFSASQAHADEDPGLLGAVASTVDATTSTVTDVVDGTTSAVVQTVAPVAEAVVTAAPALPVTPVVEVVEATVSPVLATVTEVADSGVVAPIVDTTVTVVGAVPVVGGVVSALGADDTLSSVGSSVDGVLQGTTTTVAGTVTDVDDTTGGIVADPIESPVTGVEIPLAGTVAHAHADAAANPVETLMRAVYLTGAAAWLSLTSDPSAVLSSEDGASVTGSAVGGTLALLRSVMQADSVLSGSAGAGPGAWVLVALGFVVAYRAWVRRTGLENDVAPPAPAYSTDVSPD